ncbi:MAG: hypothetical protein JWO69_1046 [Thermoleophilia bacterium]|nr:hypothetical protein [Thermoleophilia bacterium]
MERRRRTDQLPDPQQLPSDPIARARVVCEYVRATGFGAAVALQVPDNGGQGVVCASAGAVDSLLDVARGVARQVASSGRPLEQLDTSERLGLRRWRHAGIQLGAVRGGTIVLVVSDTSLTKREGQALAAWAAPAAAGIANVRGGPCADLARGLSSEFAADAVIFALFAQSGMLLNLHVRSGGLLRSWRIPADTVWGEVARHGAAFTLGDLPMHPGAELLASLGMRTAGLVGLENGNGLAIGAVGVASFGDLDIDVAHHLLARSPRLGREIMTRLSTTPVPVPADDGTIDLQVLAARVGCRRFAMYERDGSKLRIASAHAKDGSRLVSAPDPGEQELVRWAVEQGVGVVNADAAAVLIGDHTVLYAQDPNRNALEHLRLALQDIRRNPFGGEDPMLDVRDADVDAA